ncbi:MAG: Ig-like domain-containing protein, partial [candidate division WOR-3 bacterium]
STPPYFWIWDTRSCNNGSYILKVVAYDSSSQYSEESIIVTVYNLGIDEIPNIIMLSPSPGDKISGEKLRIYANIEDERGISKVEVYLNDILYITNNSGIKGLYEFSIDVNNLRSGYYHIKIVAYDTSNQCNSVQQVIYLENNRKINEEFFVSPNGDGINDVVNFSTNNDVKIYDINGILVKTLNGNEPWNATDESGKKVSSGFYIFVIEKENTTGSIVVSK